MIDRLIEKIDKTENPTVVGLDPLYEMIPEKIKREMLEKHGKTPKAVAEMFWLFNKQLIDGLCDMVPAVKPQIAMYEKYGTEGIRVYIETTKYAKEKGLIVIGDVKRGDIASTAAAYASHLEGVDIEGEKFDIWHTDAVTLNPYMGYDVIEPFIKPCIDNDKGMFILVKTSNKSGESFQELKLCVSGFNDTLFFQRVAEYVRDWGKLAMGQNGYSKVGAVLGATSSRFSILGSFGKKMRKMMPNTFFLIPGYGAQGGTGKDVKDFFDKDKRGCIVNSSRGIIAAYQKDSKYSDENFVDAAREAALLMQKDLRR